MRFARNVKRRDEKFGAVVFDTLTEKVFVTNETGQAILRLIEEGAEVPAVVSRLLEEHDGDPETIEADVRGFVASLKSAGLLERSEAES